MIDAALRRATAPGLARAGETMARAGVRPLWLTTAGWVVGVGACIAAATHHFDVALAAWVANRACDALDGPVARAVGTTDRGGFADIVADFSIYGGFVAAMAVAEPGARVACLALLVAYYVSGTAFLSLSSLVERRGDGATALRDERSLRFAGGLAEGAETAAVYVALCLAPGATAVIAWVFTAMVVVTAAQRIRLGWHVLAPPVAARCPEASASDRRA